MPQALGIDFTAVSISEANETYRNVIQANHRHAIQTVFDDVKAQVNHHRLAKASPDIGVTGSPCNPFSCQRTKRFATGNVASHVDFDTTMTSVVDFYSTVEPKLGITEQVMGFEKPFSSSDDRTPLNVFLNFDSRIMYVLLMVYWMANKQSTIVKVGDIIAQKF